MLRKSLLAISITLSATVIPWSVEATTWDKNRPSEERRPASPPVALDENESALETPAMSRRFWMEPRLDRRDNGPRNHGGQKSQ